MSTKPDTLELDERSIGQKIRDFSSLLDQITTIDDKKRQLWKEIYENAVSDRQNAYALFSTVVTIADIKSAEHAVHGKSIATYIERMSRANDQLIRLAELIAKADENKQQGVTKDSLFDMISKGGTH